MEYNVTNILKLMNMDDFDFYDAYVSQLTIKEQSEFFSWFPDFLESDSV